MLSDIFRPAHRRGDDEIFFPPDEYPGLATDLLCTRVLFNHGRQEGHWVDAEQFLAYVDDAHHDDGRKTARRQMLAKLCEWCASSKVSPRMRTWQIEIARG